MQVVAPSLPEESAPSPRQPRPRQPRAARTDAGAKGNPVVAPGNAGPVPASVTEVLALFERRRAELRFPGVDAESLRALVERVETLRVEAATALAQWEAARAASERSEVELLEMSKRAVAYARVFATDDPTLSSELDAILRSEPERGKRRKRDASAAPESANAAGTPAAGTLSAEPTRSRRAPRREAHESKPAVEETATLPQ
jgi:hypothetical protein